MMTARKHYWEVVADSLKSDSDSVRPNRGNILSCDGQLLASSIPEYKIFMDFQAGNAEDTAWAHKRDTLWRDSLDSLCLGLHRIFPEWTAEQFKKRLEEGRTKVITNKRTGVTSVGARHWAVWPKRISYSTYCEVAELPYFSLPANKAVSTMSVLKPVAVPLARWPSVPLAISAVSRAAGIRPVSVWNSIMTLCSVARPEFSVGRKCSTRWCPLS
jgi:cell division protein FtsI/penicillin-binding protein 2